MNSNEIKTLAEKVLMKTYGRYDLALARGQGARVYDPEGNEYLDFVSGLAVTSLGHSNPALADIITDQARTLVHVSNLYYTEPQVKLAKVLTENCFADRVFFANSGAEANEAAIKLVRKYSFDKYGLGRHQIITMGNSFHGRTMLTLTATAQTDKHHGFKPLVEGFTYLPFNDLTALEQALSEETCAVMIEPIQGEGGVNEAEAGYLSKLAELCRSRDVLLIFDEIQVGMGRTGAMFAHQLYGVEPDIMTLAKALANGLPIGAALAREEVAQAFGPGTHASTFGGTPLVTAAALYVVEKMLEPGFLDQVKRVGAYFKSRLSDLVTKYDYVKEVRGQGLILGVQLDFPGAEVVAKLINKGFLINCLQEKVLRFLPPLIITEVEVDLLMPVLEETLAAVAAQQEV
ncbi:MAG: aspartate aminotransferase family protein [Deltaproteobacteria bacterium]|nr:aspartate aminotransferase family protein [Deltaproteobacteria bacterium]MBW2051153.1 aspartate aminotransferase family protein [Deltaproteobacteria bacterium]MBW2139947.1 aspartate aminotransferase family protein [Deltaproteobacteria bacterium]MBW2323820.1 aspartate aminotransferase family protein [Deltaproteobacteria bacterium]